MWIIFIWRWVRKANDPEPVSNSCRLKSREEQTSRYLTTPPSTHQLSAFTSDRALNALHCTQPANASITDTFRSRDQTVHCPILQSLVLIVQFCDPFLIGDYYQFVTGLCIRAARKVFMIQSYHNHLPPPGKWKKIYTYFSVDQQVWISRSFVQLRSLKCSIWAIEMPLPVDHTYILRIRPLMKPHYEHVPTSWVFVMLPDFSLEVLKTVLCSHMSPLAQSTYYIRLPLILLIYYIPTT